MEKQFQRCPLWWIFIGYYSIVDTMYSNEYKYVKRFAACVRSLLIQLRLVDFKIKKDSHL